MRLKVHWDRRALNTDTHKQHIPTIPPTSNSVDRSPAFLASRWAETHKHRVHYVSSPSSAVCWQPDTWVDCSLYPEDKPSAPWSVRSLSNSATLFISLFQFNILVYISITQLLHYKQTIENSLTVLYYMLAMFLWIITNETRRSQ